MYSARSALAAIAVIALAGGCGGGSDTTQPEPVARPATSPVPPADPVARELDGIYGAELDAGALRQALATIKPPVALHGGYWTLTIDVGARRLTFSHPEEGDYTQRITAVDDSYIDLAPDTGCEQRGAARTEGARLAWFQSGAVLRLKAVRVPCLTNKVLLTLTPWRKT